MADLIGQKLGNYRIEGNLGVGGMGEVYRAVHVRLNRPAAIKVLHANQAADPTFQARFLREARAAAALSHPHIVEVFDFGEQDGASYLVMELVPDGSLRTLLRQRSTGQGWTLGLGVDLVRQAAEGLAYAHAQGMVHRDIKPDNLLLQRLALPERPNYVGLAERYQLKISDFGLARLVDDAGELTVTGMVMGTPTYMSPEQCQGAALDGRSDLYSLGVVLYEVATGSPPFRAKSLSEAVFKHISTPPVPPREIQPDLPPMLEEVILCCLAKNPEERFANGMELAEALDGSLGSTDLQTIVSPRDADMVVTPVPAMPPADIAPTEIDSRPGMQPPALPVQVVAQQRSTNSHDDVTLRASVGAGPALRSPRWQDAHASVSNGTADSGIVKMLLAQPKSLRIGGVALLALSVILITALGFGLLRSFANSGGHGTSVARGTPTLAASPTPANKVTFHDSLSTPSSRWPSSARSYFNQGGYEINGAWLVFAPSGPLSNGSVSVRLRQVGGVNNQFYGIAVRARNNQSYYVFGLSETQQWTFSLVSYGSHRALVAPTTDTHINRGPNASNTITVYMRGSHFIFYANGVQIGQADDSTYASGQVGIVNIVSHLDVIYNDFTVSVPA